MYLTYDEYKAMGGTLEESAYITVEKKARYLIKSQCGGLTGQRIDSLDEIPEAVKDCMSELIVHICANKGADSQIASMSQSQGGRSESVSYVAKSKADIDAEADSIIFNTLFGGGFGFLLYGGADI